MWECQGWGAMLEQHAFKVESFRRREFTMERGRATPVAPAVRPGRSSKGVLQIDPPHRPAPVLQTGRSSTGKIGRMLLG